MTTAGVRPGFKLVDRRDDSPDTYNHERTPVKGVFGALAESLSSLFGGVVRTVGRVLGGATNLAIGVFGEILKGVQGLVRGTMSWIGGLFKKNPDPVVPPFISPIAADLEGEVKPMVDRIEGAHKSIEEHQKETARLAEEQKSISQRIDDFLKEGGELQRALDGINSSVGEKVKRLEQADERANTQLQELKSFKDGMDSRLSTLANEIKSDLNSASALGQVQESVVQQITSSLQVGGSLAGQINELTRARDGQSFADFWNENGQTILDMRGWYEQWNNNQWALQKEFNDLQTNWNSRVEGVLDKQVQVNTDQASFNDMLTEHLEVSKWYRKYNDALWKMQQEWNDKTSGWIALQTRISTARAAWENMQEELNTRTQETIRELGENQVRILELSAKQQEYIPRKIVAEYDRSFNSTTPEHFENEHWNIHPKTRQITARGDWVGQAVVRTYWNPKDTKSDVIASYEQLFDIPASNGARSHVVGPFRASQRYEARAIAVDYFVRQGEAKSSRDRGSTVFPLPNRWHTVNTFKVAATATHAVTFACTWRAATYGDSYGVRVTKNGSVLTSIGPKTGVGPLTPFGNGTKTQAVIPMSVKLSKGDVLRFEVYTSANQESQRQVDNWERQASWIES
ncbi:hypothetical protein [Corynebacterium accolens]|uniref:hypothetical protein n=1 Tax=Corynebacterium accolens TaxID=38284 RepID=UPI00266FF598|nr:hypothetical protein [Corynebacterium accolens]WKS54892.1 hypothetical protein NLL31_06585 [Corynebacterium accolens]